MKIGIIGAGNVGSTIAYTLAIGEAVSEIVLVDKNIDKAKGEVLDIRHGLPFIPYLDLRAGDYESLEGMDAVVLTAGLPRRPGQSRLDLAKNNINLFKQIIPKLVEVNPDCIILVVSNPVDILTYAAYKISGFPAHRVFGSGNVLDSARFRSMLGDYFQIDPANIHAYILGEHGDSGFPLLSQAFAGCTPLTKLPGYDERQIMGICENVKSVAAKVIKYKGSTYYAVSLGVQKILSAIDHDQNRVLPVSTYLSDYFGVSDVCLSVPAVVNRDGIREVLRVPFTDLEETNFRDCAKKIKRVLMESGLKDE
ncbi:MAG: L-lactate dehydrogenase [Candidatus Altiarchaeales archaeon]|nr:L-lactate dehydrogenase [Candidatus Altiarchaeales archaeon]